MNVRGLLCGKSIRWSSREWPDELNARVILTAADRQCQYYFYKNCRNGSVALGEGTVVAEIPRIAASSSINAVNSSSARTTNRFPSRCASAIQIASALLSVADRQLQLQPALLRLSAMIYSFFL